MTKVLYFEGAGWEDADISKNTIGNCRVRTSFLNNLKKQIYLEMSAGIFYNQKHKKEIERYFLYVDSCFYITGDKDDENEFQINFNNQDLKNNYDYSKKDITKWINKNLNCNFNTIKVLPNLGGYNAFANDNCKCNKYNLMENYIYNPQLIKKREEIYKYFYNLEKSEGKKYPNFSLWVDKKNVNLLHLLRYFNGYNKYWTIRTDIKNWKEAIKENIIIRK